MRDCSVSALVSRRPSSATSRCRFEGRSPMTDWTERKMPYEKLVAFQVARELLLVVQAAQITDPKLRDQAMRAAKSACLNIAEATGRGTVADQKRVYNIARG